MKRTFISIALILANFWAFSQIETRGIQPMKKAESAAGINHALIIGVSDYQDDDIPDLKYADKDAEALAAFLQSKEGGNLPANAIHLLLNKNATKANIQAATDALVKKTKKGEKVIIYFSGHGDVEVVTDREEGFLLTHDSPSNNYIAGAFKVEWMQEIIRKISVEKGGQVFMISDACRSGSLAGNSAGTQATAAVMAQQFDNEIKIMSCQPSELSVEGEQWGGGRGCFSYHLIEGMKGAADKNGDAFINVLEIENYLENIVPEEAAPLSQIPFTSGSKTAKLIQVKNAILGQAKGEKTTTKAANTIDAFLENQASSSQLLYQQFKVAIEEGNLLQPANASAEFFFNQLIQKTELQAFFDDITSDYTIALQNEAQQYINLMLKGDPVLLDDYIYKRNKSVADLPKYLAKSAEFLGEKHYMYNNLKMKEYFFRGVALRDQLKTTSQTEEESLALNEEAFAHYQKALELDSTAAFVQLALANIHMDKNDYINSLTCADKAINLAPTWALAKATKGQIYSKMNQKGKAVACYEKALELDNTQIYIMQWLENDFSQLGNYEKADYWNKQQIKSIQEKYRENPFEAPEYYQGILAIALSESGDYEKAENLFQKVIKHTQEKDANLLHLRAVNFFRLNQYEEALIWNTKALQLDNTAAFWASQASIQLELEDVKSTKKSLQKAQKLDKNFAHTFWVEGQYFEKLNKAKKAASSYQKAFELEPSNIGFLKALIAANESLVKTEPEITALFDWANQLNPENPNILKAFALWYRKIGAKTQARDFLKRALKAKKL